MNVETMPVEEARRRCLQDRLPGNGVSFLHLVFCLILIALFIPLPKFGLPVSAENVLYAIGAILLLSRSLGQRVPIHPGAKAIALLILAFTAAQFLVKYLAFGAGSLQYAGTLRRALLVLLAPLAVRSLRHYRLAYYAVLGAVVFNATLGVLNVFDFGPAVALQRFHSSMIVEDVETYEERAEIADSRAVGLRASAFAASYLFAPAVLMALGLMLSDGLSPRRRFRTILCLAAIATLTLAMVLNAERSQFVALTAGWLVIVGQKRNRAMIALFGLVAVAGVLLLAYQRKETLLEHQGSEGVSLYHRMQGTKSVETKARLSLPVAGLLTVLKHPFSGGSEMDYQEMAQGLPAITDYHGFSGDVPASHNNYIGAGRRAGMLGWAIIGAILFQLWRMMTPLKLLESRLSYEAGMFLERAQRSSHPWLMRSFITRESLRAKL